MRQHGGKRYAAHHQNRRHGVGSVPPFDFALRNGFDCTTRTIRNIGALHETKHDNTCHQTANVKSVYVQTFDYAVDEVRTGMMGRDG